MLARRSLLAAGAVGLCAGPAVAQAPELRIGYQRNGLLLIAKHQGRLERRFGPQGIGIRWVEFSFGPPLLEALGTGSIDYGPTGDAPPIFAQAARSNLLYVAAQEAAGSGSAILLPPGSTLQTLADLRGKRIGFARASSAHNLTIAALEKAGIGWDEITPIQLAPAEARAAFERGAIDAWTIWDPFFAVAEAREGVRILSLARGIVTQNSFFLANGDFVRRRPDLVRALNAELADVAIWAEANRPEVAKLLSDGTGIDLAAWRRAIDRTEFGIGPLSEAVIAEQQRIADRFHRLKLIPNTIRVGDIVWEGRGA